MKRRVCDFSCGGFLWRFAAALAAVFFGLAPVAAAPQVSDLTLLLVQPVVTISAPDPVASEAGPSSGLAVVHRTGSTNEPLTVFYHVEGSATSGLDFQRLPGQVTIPAGSSRGTILVTPVNDPMAETNETVKLILTVSMPVPPPGGGITLAYKIGEHAAATVTIMDDDVGFTSVPTVSLTVSDDKASEQGRATATFLVTRLGPTKDALRVEYGQVEFGWGMGPPMHQPPGDDIARYPAALNGVDYELLSGSVTIPAGSAKAAIVVRPIDDAVYEGPERVSLSLKESRTYHLNPPIQQSIVIADNDPTNRPPSVHITQPQSGASFAAPASITIRAEASDPDGKIERLDIFAGDKLLGSAKTSPLAVTWTNVPPGEYTLTARALDNRGASAASAPVRITVTAGGGAGLDVKINFQPSGVSVPTGYRLDSGKVYGPREGGLSYGWTKDNQENTRNRNSSRSPDQRYDTFAYLQRVPESVWELGVPEGTYQVRVVAGDPSSFESVYGINVEGILAVSGTPKSTNRWLEGNVRVTVKDGRLTVSNRPEAQNNKICFLEVKGEGVATNKPPLITIASPIDGAAFTGPTNIAIRAEASDPDGTVRKVEFFAGDRLLGTLTNSPFTLVWTNAAAGTNSLTARATDDKGAKTTSRAVRITVTAPVPQPPPAITVTTTDSEASERPVSANSTNTATFAIQRTGSTHQPLGVRYSLSGTAVQGVDYAKLGDSAGSLWITIPAGASKTNIVIHPINDTLVEGTENVVLTLESPPTPTVFPPPPPAYVVGTPGSATALILDDDLPTNRPPEVRIISPPEGATFTAPTNITLIAHANDPDGFTTLKTVEFFQGPNRLGITTNLPTMNPLGPFVLTWTNVQAGAYTLTARAKDNAGATATSAPVRITVTGGGAGLNAKINFQPAGSTAPEGYRADSGKVYGPREAGLSYGWNKDNQENTRDRNSQLSPDQRYDTFAYLQRVPELVWELGVPNGTYQVRVVAGDPTSFASVYGLNVEGVQAVKGTPTSTNRWLEGNVTVTVQDGRLTVGNRAEAQNNKICFIEVKGEGVATNKPPLVTIAGPIDGAAFTGPTNIAIRAEASDPDGTVRKVEFFAGDRLLGTLTNSPFTLVWTNAAAGTNSLTARATDDKGAKTTSHPVRVTVTEPVRQAEVNVIATDVEASEAGAGGALNTATFRILRSGSTNFALPVFFAISGTASNGVDYTRISNSLVIPKGASSAEIKIRPIDDLLAEGNETIMVTIVPPVCIEIFPPPPECYLVGPTNRATAHMVDNDTKTNLPPRIEIVKPTNNASFKAPALIPFEAVARDPDGYAPKVEFFAGTNKIGQSVITFIQAPPPNQPLTHAFLWTNAPAGEYTLTAKATDDQGASGISAPVHILVQSSVSRITISSPTNDASFSGPANITINATAVDPNGYINRVEFYAGSNKIGVSELIFFRAPDPGEPIHHTFQWKTVPPGTYVLTVKAKDTLGRAVTSEPVRITVHGPRLGGLSAVKALNPDGVELTFSAEAGRTYRVEATTDFLTWTELTTLTSAGDTFQFTDQSAAGQPRRFYRAVLAE